MRTSIAHEIDDIRAVAAVIREPMLVVGHSSGGVIALEALMALPSTFASAVVCEPPMVIGPPLGGEALERARAAIAAGKPGKAMTIFVQEIVGLPPLIARLAGFYIAVNPRMRGFASGWDRAAERQSGGAPGTPRALLAFKDERWNIFRHPDPIDMPSPLAEQLL